MRGNLGFRWGAILAGCLLAGCATSEDIGDAAVYATPNLLGSSGETIYLPKFAIGDAGLVYEFEVNRPGRPTYPRRMIYHARALYSSRYQTHWEDSRIRLEMIDPATGRTVYDRVVHPRTWRIVDIDRYEHILEGPKAGPRFTLDRYTLRVTVLEPSKRALDKAQIMLTAAD